MMTNTTETLSKEQRILRMVKKTLTDVAKDTYTPPEMRHPLSEQTINNIREVKFSPLIWIAMMGINSK